jgi:Xaa-Pro aminopeptidase
MRIRIAVAAAALSLAALTTLPLHARSGAADATVFTTAFTPQEFAARRAKVMNAIGDGVAILSGATETPTYTKFRQGAQFFYLCGAEVPRAILLIDGKTKTSTLFLGPGGPSNEGPQLGPGADAENITGVEHVVDRAQFATAAAALAGRTIYMPNRQETLGAGTTDRVQAHQRAADADPWDQTKPKEIVFRDKVAAAAPGATMKDLDPILDGLRMIKSPAEIAMLRESTRIASLGILEAMKSAKVGMYEYEIEAVADYVFKRHNAQGIAYFALVATGTNAAWPHYHAAQSQLQDGDLVLMDYAPDYHYYTSDVTRMFPASGRFTPRQRELYGIYVKLYNALLASIGPGSANERMTKAHDEMMKIMASYAFTDQKIKDAATKFVAGYANPRGSYGHFLGMDTHDVGRGDGTLTPGMVFTIEPALTIPDEKVYIRLEDPVVITATGFEHLSKGLPMEIDDVEKAMKEPGLADAWKDPAQGQPLAKGRGGALRP